MNELKFVLKSLKKHGFLFGFLILFMNIIDLSTLIILGYYLKLLNNDGSFQSRLGYFNLDWDLSSIGIFFIFILILLYISAVVLTYFLNKKSILYGFEMSADLFENNFINFDAIREQNKSEFISKLFTETNRFATNVIMQFFQLISRVILTLVILVVLIVVSAKITLLVAGVFLIIALAYFQLTKDKLKSNSRELTMLNMSRLRILDESVGGAEYLLTYNRVGVVLDEFREASLKFGHRHSQNQTIEALPKYILEAIVVLFIIGLSLVLIANNSPSTYSELLIIFGLAGLKLLPSVNIILSSTTRIAANMDSIRVVREELEKITDLRTSRIEEVNNAITNVSLDCISFGFSQDILFKDFSVKFEYGSVYHLSGYSGRGKSTLFRLILGLYSPHDGVIRINGVDLERINRRGFYSEIGYVSQNVYLFEGTVIENILMGRKDVPEKLSRTMLGCGIDFYSQPIMTLSGGQVQRIGIARALYSNPSLLLFDEAFTGLDYEMEVMIRNFILKDYMSDSIIIEISHTSTFKDSVSIAL